MKRDQDWNRGDRLGEAKTDGGLDLDGGWSSRNGGKRTDVGTEWM